MVRHSHTCQPSWKLTLHPAVPEAFKISPEIIHEASAYAKNKTKSTEVWPWQNTSGSGWVPATGWMPVGYKFQTIAQGVSKQVVATVEWE